MDKILYDLETMQDNPRSKDPIIAHKVAKRRNNIPQRQVDEIYNIIIEYGNVPLSILDNLKLEIRTGLSFLRIVDKTCKSCENKNKKQLKRCSKCEVVYYCNKECQRKDWKEHKIECVNNNK